MNSIVPSFRAFVRLQAPFRDSGVEGLGFEGAASLVECVGTSLYLQTGESSHVFSGAPL